MSSYVLSTTYTRSHSFRCFFCCFFSLVCRLHITYTAHKCLSVVLCVAMLTVYCSVAQSYIRSEAKKKHRAELLFLVLHVHSDVAYEVPACVSMCNICHRRLNKNNERDFISKRLNKHTDTTKKKENDASRRQERIKFLNYEIFSLPAYYYWIFFLLVLFFYYYNCRDLRS